MHTSFVTCTSLMYQKGCFFKQEGYDYPYIPPLLNDSVQLLTQAVNKSIALLCNGTSDCLTGNQSMWYNDLAIFSNTLSSLLLEASFEGKSVSTYNHSQISAWRILMQWKVVTSYEYLSIVVNIYSFISTSIFDC